MGHSHNHGSGTNEKRLWLTMGLTGAFMVAEVVAGLLTHSLALLSDAAHMFTDVAALGISLGALHIAKRPADSNRTYGYYRFEILAAAFNAVLLFAVAGYIAYEAYERFQRPAAIQSDGMLAVALVGLLINLIGLRILKAGSAESLNIKGAYLEVWSDMLGSIGVIFAALVIKMTGWWPADPLIAVVISLWILPRTWILLSESLNVLLEGVPKGLALAEINDVLKNIEGVIDVHDLHVWAITSGKTSLTAHLLIDGSKDMNVLLSEVNTTLEQRFHIEHTTVQVEAQQCAPGEVACKLNTQTHTH